MKGDGIMAIEQEERSPIYIIPRNYEDSFITAGGISFRSIAEGALLAALTVPIFIFLPIRLLYRAILIAIFGGGLFAFGVIGIKHCYLSEFIIKFFKFKGSCHEMERNDDGIFDELIAEVNHNEEDNTEETDNHADADENDDNIATEADNSNNKKKKRRKKGKSK